MKVKVVEVKTGGSCNFCKRGELNKNGIRLSYPYRYVYELSSGQGGLVANICIDCFSELEAEIGLTK